MRIVHISDCYLPRVGGIETQVRAVAMQQAAAGHEVIVITATPGDAPEDAGVRVVRLDANLPLQTPMHPKGIALIRDELEATVPDVVHVHAGVISPFAWMGIEAAKDFPTAVTVHSMWGPISQRAFATNLGKWQTRKFVITAVSDVAAESVRAGLKMDMPVLITPNACDIDFWRETQHLPHEGIHVVSTLRFSPRKRVMSLLKALRDVRAWLPADIRIRATVMGDGSLMPQVRHFIISNGIDWVKLPGRVSRTELRDIYATADVYMQPTIRESFGLAALEARTAGLPVIGMAESGLTEFIADGVDGVLATSDAGLAGALQRLILDPVTREHIAQHNRDVVPVFDWSNALAAYEAAYEAAKERFASAP